MSGFLWFLLLLNAYILVVYLIHRSGRFGGKVELAGPLVMWKTQAGKRTIDRIAKAAPRFWERWADLAIWTTWGAGILIFALLVFQLYVVITRPIDVAQNAPDPQLLLGIPGINRMIPVSYGTAALVIALVIHEGSHGVLARVGNVGVKSLGLLFFILPIGAFVEPDEKDLERASTRAKNRVFAAGPMANIALALVSGVLFSAVFMGSVGVANDGRGVGVGSLVDDGPAAAAGLAPGDIVTAIDGVHVTSLASFNAALNATRAGQTVRVEFLHDGGTRTASVTLADRWEAVERSAPQQNKPENRGKGFLGVGVFPLEFVNALTGVLANPFRDGPLDSFNPNVGGSFIIYSSYPFVVIAEGVDILADPYRDFIVIEGPLASLPPTAFYVTATMLYWLFWLNLMLGTFNALPMGPLDGGQMFKATLRERLFRAYRVDASRLKIEHEIGVPGARLASDDAETQVKLDRVNRTVRRATWTLGFFILGLILLPIVGPRLIRLFL